MQNTPPHNPQHPTRQQGAAQFHPRMSEQPVNQTNHHQPQQPFAGTNLPSKQKLVRSTVTAAIVAMVLLVTIVMPSEYGIDPLRTGRLLGLSEMGEIKTQLAAEAAVDAAKSEGAEGTDLKMALQLAAINQRLESMQAQLDLVVAVGPEEVDRPSLAATPTKQPEPQPNVLKQTLLNAQPAPVAVPTPAPIPEPASVGRQDEATVILQPGQGIEIKLVMDKGAIASFAWSANGSVLNYDTHGDGGGNSISYKKGRGEPGEEGELTAAFTGNHGWFWRNRTQSPVTLTLKTWGDYRDFKRVS